MNTVEFQLTCALMSVTIAGLFGWLLVTTGLVRAIGLMLLFGLGLIVAAHPLIGLTSFTIAFMATVVIGVITPFSGGLTDFFKWLNGPNQNRASLLVWLTLGAWLATLVHFGGTVKHTLSMAELASKDLATAYVEYAKPDTKLTTKELVELQLEKERAHLAVQLAPTPTPKPSTQQPADPVNKWQATVSFLIALSMSVIALPYFVLSYREELMLFAEERGEDAREVVESLLGWFTKPRETTTTGGGGTTSESPDITRRMNWHLLIDILSNVLLHRVR